MTVLVRLHSTVVRSGYREYDKCLQIFIYQVCSLWTVNSKFSMLWSTYWFFAILIAFSIWVSSCYSGSLNKCFNMYMYLSFYILYCTCKCTLWLNQWHLLHMISMTCSCAWLNFCEARPNGFRSQLCPFFKILINYIHTLYILIFFDKSDIWRYTHCIQW